jgi:4-amino-4-deoxy-L-arabinose transferase-like glycosyltransferase
MTAAVARAPRYERIAPRPAPAAAPPAPAPATLPRWAAPASVVVLAAVLRFAGLGSMRDNSFYDAAVRSMGGSWHAFATGAIDPSSAVAVDKPPVDLWLQVASTKLLGFGTFALHLPEALGGTLAVLALYVLLSTLFGRRAALGGALALAVLPMAVITSRSDTMDSVMAALVIAAAALVAHGARDERRRWPMPAAGAMLGLAFEVKLFEALVVAPALVALWWLGSSLPRRARAAALGGAAVAFVVVALAWLVALPAIGGGQRPWAFGSTNGSAWNATFVYDGLDRLTGSPPQTTPVAPRPRRPPSTAQLRHQRALLKHRAAIARREEPAPASPWRLFATADGTGTRTGIALALALLALLTAWLARAGDHLDRVGRAGAVAIVGWMATGVVLFSAQGSLKPRYLEAVDPAIAAVLGAGVVLVARRLTRGSASLGGPHARRVVTIAALAGVLAAPAAVSVAAVSGRIEDAGAPGALVPARLTALSRYLRAHRDGARYEVAALTVGAAASLIARDGQPVEMLAANDARPIVTIAQLRRTIVSGDVRTVLLGARCTPLSSDLLTGCSPLAGWVRAHGRDVSRAAGQAHAGVVYSVAPALALAPASRVSARARRETPTSGRSLRSHDGRARRPRRASRAWRQGSGRGRPRSRRGTIPTSAPSRRAAATTAASPWPDSRRDAATAPGSAAPRQTRLRPCRRTGRPGRRCRGSRASRPA